MAAPVSGYLGFVCVRWEEVETDIFSEGSHQLLEQNVFTVPRLLKEEMSFFFSEFNLVKKR